VEKVAQTLEELNLIGSSWQAESFGGPDPVDQLQVITGTRLTVNFGVDRYAGTGGCNFFLGVYTIEGESMRFQTPATTVATCTPQEIMNQEGTFVASLRNIIGYAKDGDKLLGYTSGNQLLLTLVPAPTVEFEDTVWELRFQEYGNGLTPIVAGTEVTATFASGTVSGSAGCNTFSSPYTLGDDGAFSASAVTSTRLSCEEPKGIMDQETQFLTNLQTATKLIQTGGLVQLIGPDGKTIAALGTN